MTLTVTLVTTTLASLIVAVSIYSAWVRVVTVRRDNERERIAYLVSVRGTRQHRKALQAHEQELEQTGKRAAISGALGEGVGMATIMVVVSVLAVVVKVANVMVLMKGYLEVTFVVLVTYMAFSTDFSGVGVVVNIGKSNGNGIYRNRFHRFYISVFSYKRDKLPP